MAPAAHGRGGGEGTPRRLVVIGTTGSGKSTLAERLADRLGVPLVELDALHWEPFWTPAEDEVFRGRVRAAVAGDGWVVAGNYGRLTRDITWARAQAVVFLDYPLSLVLRRLVARTWRRWRTRQVLWGTNQEKFWEHFYHRDSLILWALRTHGPHRSGFREVQRDPRWAHLDFVRLGSPTQAERWLDALAADAGHVDRARGFRPAGGPRGRDPGGPPRSAWSSGSPWW